MTDNKTQNTNDDQDSKAKGFEADAPTADNLHPEIQRAPQAAPGSDVAESSDEAVKKLQGK